MKKIYDIFEQFQNDSTKTIKENFANLLKEYIHAQYKGANENEIFKKFALDFEKETGHQANKDWINPKKIGGISRKSILEIAFVLNQNSNNGEEICNNLLQTMHFPRIHATSENELFYLFALRNGRSYEECKTLYQSYIQNHKRDCVLSATGTSTFYYNQFKDITREEQLFEFLNERDFGVVSKKINSLFIDNFSKMMLDGYKITIHNYANQRTIQNSAEVIGQIADAIVKALEISPTYEKKVRKDILEDLKKTAKLCDRESLILYLHGKKNMESICNLIEQYNGSVKVKPFSQIEAMLDLYLFYSSDQYSSSAAMTYFFKGFNKTSFVLEMSYENDSWSTESPRQRYSKYLDSYLEKNDRKKRNKSAPKFLYPFNIRFSSFFNGLRDVEKNKESLSREALLFWLLYYYDSASEKFYSIYEINSILGEGQYQRFRLLDEQCYFDRFIIMVTRFSLGEDGKILYDQEEIEKTDLNVSNIHELRRSVIHLFLKTYYRRLKINFIDTDNFTTKKI